MQVKLIGDEMNGDSSVCMVSSGSPQTCCQGKILRSLGEGCDTTDFCFVHLEEDTSL